MVLFAFLYTDSISQLMKCDHIQNLKAPEYCFPAVEYSSGF